MTAPKGKKDSDSKSVDVHTQQAVEPIVVTALEDQPTPTPPDGPAAVPVIDTAAPTPTVASLADPDDDEAPDPAFKRAKKGHQFVTYLGVADRLDFTHPDKPGTIFTFEPGVPVEVPKDIAEALLTTPFEEFAVTGKVPAPVTEE